MTVPGAVAGWAALSQRFGALPFADLMEPAVELAERGHAVAPVIADKWARAMPLLHDKPGFAQAFLPRGRAPLPGERFVFAEAGRALRAIAETRGEAFYCGEIAQAIEAFAREHGAQLRASDLAAHEVLWTDTITTPFAGLPAGSLAEGAAKISVAPASLGAGYLAFFLYSSLIGVAAVVLTFVLVGRNRKAAPAVVD